jgi:hypothetical protein
MLACGWSGGFLSTLQIQRFVLVFLNSSRVLSGYIVDQGYMECLSLFQWPPTPTCSPLTTVLGLTPP